MKFPPPCFHAPVRLFRSNLNVKHGILSFSAVSGEFTRPQLSSHLCVRLPVKSMTGTLLLTDQQILHKCVCVSSRVGLTILNLLPDIGDCTRCSVSGRFAFTVTIKKHLKGGRGKNLTQYLLLGPLNPAPLFFLSE